MRFKFIQDKKKFCFQNDNIKIVFSNPSIQSFSEFSTLLNAKGILYYYYTVDIFEKKYGRSKMSKAFSISTYDAPAMVNLQKGFNEFLQMPRENFQKEIISFENCQTTRYSYRWDVWGEDSYHITRTDNCKNGKFEDSRYQLEINGFTEGSYVTNGIHINYLTSDELLEFKKCIDAFIEYSIKENNKVVNRMNATAASNTYVKNNRLYVKNDCGYELICKPEDVVEIVLAAPQQKNGQTTWKTIHSDFTNTDVTIKSIEEDKVVLRNGNKTIEVPPSSIVYIHKEASDKEIHYSLSQIADEFISAVSGEDLENFRGNIDSEKESELYRMYFNVLINRTWMCRPEHKFVENYEGGLDNASTFVSEAIKKIIQKLKK